MAVTLRLARFGKKNFPVYRIVATNKESKRDGKFIEVLGHYNAKTSPAQVDFKEDRVRYWASVGALPSATIKRLLSPKLGGLFENLETGRKKKITDRRKARKVRAKSAKKTSAKKASK